MALHIMSLIEHVQFWNADLERPQRVSAVVLLFVVNQLSGSQMNRPFSCQRTPKLFRVWPQIPISQEFVPGTLGCFKNACCELVDQFIGSQTFYLVTQNTDLMFAREPR